MTQILAHLNVASVSQQELNSYKSKAILVKESENISVETGIYRQENDSCSCPFSLTLGLERGGLIAYSKGLIIRERALTRYSLNQERIAKRESLMAKEH